MDIENFSALFTRHASSKKETNSKRARCGWPDYSFGLESSAFSMLKLNGCIESDTKKTKHQHISNEMPASRANGKDKGKNESIKNRQLFRSSRSSLDLYKLNKTK